MLHVAWWQVQSRRKTRRLPSGVKTTLERFLLLFRVEPFCSYPAALCTDAPQRERKTAEAADAIFGPNVMILFDRSFHANGGSGLCGLRSSGIRRLFHQSRVDWPGRLLPQPFSCSATRPPNLFHQFHPDWHASRDSFTDFQAGSRSRTLRIDFRPRVSFARRLPPLSHQSHYNWQREVTSSPQTALTFWQFASLFCAKSISPIAV